MAYDKLRHRLQEGRPLVVDCDVAASLGARGCSLDEPGSLAAILHREPDALRAHHLAELSCRVDVLSALTADTTPRALAESGMEHRAARLTGKAMDLLYELEEGSARPVALAGVLGPDQITATARSRSEQEIDQHAQRIAVAGAELMIVRGLGSVSELLLAIRAAVSHDVPTWTVLDRELLQLNFAQSVEGVADAGAEAVLFEASSVDDGLEMLDQLRKMGVDIVPGALLSAAPDAVRGFPSPFSPVWVERVVELTDAGARIVGGGAGTTEAHTQALTSRLGVLHPSILPQALS